MSEFWWHVLASGIAYALVEVGSAVYHYRAARKINLDR